MTIGKIIIVLKKTKADKFELSLAALKSLNKPVGYDVEVFIVEDELTGESRNSIQKERAADYYIYITDSIVVLDNELLTRVISVLMWKDVGAVGVLGTQTIAIDGLYANSKYPKGNYLCAKNNKFDLAEDVNLFTAEDDFDMVDVRLLYPEFIAVTSACEWVEGLLENTIDVSFTCREITEKNQRIVVLNAGKPLVLLNDSDIHTVVSNNLAKTFFERYSSVYNDANVVFYNEKGSLPYHIGKNVKFNFYHGLYGPEGISIGNETTFQKDCVLMLPYDNFNGIPRIEIGKSCDIGCNCHIHAVNCVKLEPEILLGTNVYIADHNHEYKNVGVPIKRQGVDSFENRVRIGYGSWLGNNVVIAGNIDIGKGCVVGANTVLTGNVTIPDYCVVVGSPGRIVKAYDMEAEKWVKDTEQLEATLKKRKYDKRPLLTIGIPTYNRLKYLKVSLAAILNQVGNNPKVEVLVSDNISTDDTAKYVKSLKKRYSNLRYHCNKENIGGDGNIFNVYWIARGEYVVACGDDDNYVDGLFDHVLPILENNHELALLHMSAQKGEYLLRMGNNVAEYINCVSFYCTFISGIIFKTDYIHSLPNPDAEIKHNFNQVYISLELIKKYNNVAVLCGAVFREDSGIHAPKGYNYAEIFIKNYLSILIKYGELSEKELSEEKLRLLNGHIFPYCKAIMNNMYDLRLDGIFDYYKEYYENESYYEDGLNYLREICKNSIMSNESEEIR